MKFIKENKELGSFKDYVKSNKNFIDPNTGIINTELVKRTINSRYPEMQKNFINRQVFDFWLNDYISLLDEVSNNEYYTKVRLNNKDCLWWKLDANGWIQDFKDNVDGEPHGDHFIPDDE
jgi:hypothetical protein